MKISERIRCANGARPDFAIDDIGDIGHWQGMGVESANDIFKGGKSVKVYCIAYIDDRYMSPASNTKIYKRFGDARKACDKINAERPDRYIKAAVLVADNWHKEDQR